MKSGAYWPVSHSLDIMPSAWAGLVTDNLSSAGTSVPFTRQFIEWFRTYIQNKTKKSFLVFIFYFLFFKN